MEVFQFYQDQKVTAWDRVHFSVTAANFEEAKVKLEAYKDKAIEYDDELSIEISHCEYQSETSEQMSVEDNGGFSTLEMYTHEGDEVMDNTPTSLLKSVATTHNEENTTMASHSIWMRLGIFLHGSPEEIGNILNGDQFLLEKEQGDITSLYTVHLEEMVNWG